MNIPVRFIFKHNLDFGIKKISKIFCNKVVIHAITDEGTVFSWGNDKERTGVLALGQCYQQATPVLNSNFLNKRVTQISLSEKHGTAIDGSLIWNKFDS